MKDYIHIATFTYPSELAIAKSSLEANDIACYVRDELTIQVHNFVSNAIGGIRLEVPQNQHENAKQILIDAGFENYLYREIEILNKDDASFKILKMTSTSDSLDVLNLTYTKNDSILSFQGLWKNDTIQIKLNKYDTSKILLTSRGFHWINEYPYNR